MRIAATWQRFDWAMLASAALLTLLGVVLLATAGEGIGARALAARQGTIFVLAVGAALFLGRLHYSLFRSLVVLSYLATVLLLVIPLIQGYVIRGTTAWIAVGSARVQPAELMKFALVLALARIVSGSRGRVLSPARLGAALVMTGIPTVLILRQPDLGSAVLLVLTTLGMLVIAGLSQLQKVILFVGTAGIAAGAWLFLLAPYQKERVLVFLEPHRDPYASGYAVLQAQTAFGSGGLVGRGLGWGPQSRLNFLPEAHTDFIFARIGEELGLVGVSVALALFGVLFYRILRAANQTSDPFGRALATGVALSLFVGLFVNVGMNVGLLPVTGVPLPFVSYGGSSLLASYLLLGLAASVRAHGERWGEETASVDEEPVQSTS